MRTQQNIVLGLLLAASAIPVTSILTLGQYGSVRAGITPLTPISDLEVTITTGGDDLRGGSVAYGVVELSGGRKEKVNLNGGRNWGNNSTNKVSVPLPKGTKLSDLVSFTLEHDGAPRNIFDSYDNWNVDALKVTTPKTCSAAVELANRSGKPFVRLTGEKTFEDIALSSSFSTKSTPVSQLQVIITTGGDDLRGGAVAYGEIKLQNGTTLSKVNLNGGRGWGNNSINTVSIPLPSATKIGDLASLRISHDGAPRNIFETYDNWNVDRVRVVTPETCSDGVQLINKTGRPLVRFTGGDTFRKYPINLP